MKGRERERESWYNTDNRRDIRSDGLSIWSQSHLGWRALAPPVQHHLKALRGKVAHFWRKVPQRQGLVESRNVTPLSLGWLDGLRRRGGTLKETVSGVFCVETRSRQEIRMGQHVERDRVESNDSIRFDSDTKPSITPRQMDATVEGCEAESKSRGVGDENNCPVSWLA